jgi:hypothetical protein
MLKIPSLIISILFLSVATIAQTNETSVCPSISVNGPEAMVYFGETAIFTASVSSGSDQKITYEWTVGEGTVEHGLRTPSISVRTPIGTTPINLSAVVRIGGLPDGCPNEGKKTVPVAPLCMLAVEADEYGKLAFEDEKPRLDNIATQLGTNPEFEALFIIYVTKSESNALVAAHVKNIKVYFVQKLGINENRLKFVFSKHDFYVTKIYLLPPDAMNDFPDVTDDLQKLRPAQ